MKKPVKLIFIDTETTSYEPDLCGVFQISGVIDIEGMPLEEFNIFSNIFENDLVRQEAFEKNGYDMEKISNLPPPYKAFLQFKSILKKHVNPYNKQDKFTAIAYHDDFDSRVLRRWFDQNGDQFFGSWFWHPWIDVMSLAAYVLQDERHKMENFQLLTVAKFVGLTPIEENLHDAIHDAILLRDLYYELVQ